MSERPISANFAFLSEHDPQIVRLGALAERYFRDDPATSLIKMRQFGETLAQLTAAKAGMFRDIQEGQADVIRRLKFERVIPEQLRPEQRLLWVLRRLEITVGEHMRQSPVEVAVLIRN